MVPNPSPLAVEFELELERLAAAIERALASLQAGQRMVETMRASNASAALAIAQTWELLRQTRAVLAAARDG